MKKLWTKYREIILYLIFGVLTTLVDMVVYTVLTDLVGKDTRVLGIPWYFYTQVIAWIAAVLFAYVTNRLWVFSDKARTTPGILRELSLFAGGRVLTLLIQMALMWFFLDLIHADAWSLAVWAASLLGQQGHFSVKLGVSVIVVILNYVFSKLFVFRKAKEASGGTK